MPDDPLFSIDPAQVREEPVLLPGNAGLAQVHVVPFTITSGPGRGHSGEVRVPFEQFTPDEVDRLVRARIASVEGIAGLGGGGA
jgi:hypothetical protein